MNGYELDDALAQNPATPPHSRSRRHSRAGAKHRERAMKEGAASFLTKPVQEEQLLTVVEELMDSAGRRQRPSATVLDRA